MNKQNELAKNTAIIAFGKICTQLISFFLLPLYTKILSTSEYGTVDLVITYCSLFLPLATLALEQSVFRYLIDVRDNENKKREYISTSLISCGIVLIILEIIIVTCYFIFNKTVLLYFGLVLFSCSLSTMFLQICRGLGDNISYSIASFITAFVQICFNIIFLVVFKMGAPGMMLATFAGNFACALYIFFRCNIRKYFSFRCTRHKTFKEMLKYSLPLIPNQLSWWVLQASDKVIVQFFIGVAGNGLIAVANKFPSVYMQFNTIFNISWTESAALHIKDEDSKEFFTKTINSVMNLFSCLCFGIIVCLPFVFPLLIHPQYNEAYGLIPIFMLASLFNVVVSVYGVIYVAYKDTVEIMKTAIFAAIINVISHLLLINFAGIYAAALSSAIGFGFMAIYRYFHSRRYIVVKLYNQSILCSCIMFAVSFVSYYSNNKLLQVIAFCLVLCISIFLNREMIKSVWKMIKEKIG